MRPVASERSSTACSIVSARKHERFIRCRTCSCNPALARTSANSPHPFPLRSLISILCAQFMLRSSCRTWAIASSSSRSPSKARLLLSVVCTIDWPFCHCCASTNRASACSHCCAWASFLPRCCSASAFCRISLKLTSCLFSFCPNHLGLLPLLRLGQRQAESAELDDLHPLIYSLKLESCGCGIFPYHLGLLP